MDKKILISTFIAIILIIFAGFFYCQLGLNQNKNNNKEQPNLENLGSKIEKNIDEQIGDYNSGAKITSFKDGILTHYYLYIISSGEEKLADFTTQTNEPPLNGTSFKSLRFSPNKKYIIYDEFGWEFAESHLYDLEKNEEIYFDAYFENTIVHLNESGKTYAFVGQNDQYLISCEGDGIIGSKYFFVLQLNPEIKKIYYTNDIGEGIVPALTCFYDTNTSRVILENDGKIIKTYTLPN